MRSVIDAAVVDVETLHPAHLSSGTYQALLRVEDVQAICRPCSWPCRAATPAATTCWGRSLAVSSGSIGVACASQPLAAGRWAVAGASAHGLGGDVMTTHLSERPASLIVRPHRSSTAFEPAATSSGLSGRGLPVMGSTISPGRSHRQGRRRSRAGILGQDVRGDRDQQNQLGFVADRCPERLAICATDAGVTVRLAAMTSSRNAGCEPGQGLLHVMTTEGVSPASKSSKAAAQTAPPGSAPVSPTTRPRRMAAISSGG